MADDFYTSDGLNSREMAILAGRYRGKFDIGLLDKVDIIEVLELKLPKLYPEFHLIVVQDENLDDYANTVFDPLCIIVRQSVYDSASRGSSFSRMILAHELGHLILHKRHENRLPAAAVRREAYVENIKNLNGLESAEAQATLFARAFLVPVNIAFRYRESITTLANVTGVSVKDAAFAATVAKRQEMYDLATGRRDM